MIELTDLAISIHDHVRMEALKLPAFQRRIVVLRTGKKCVCTALEGLLGACPKYRGWRLIASGS